MFKKLTSIILITIMTLSITACDDLIGGEIDVFTRNKNKIKIISLSSNETEILLALGLEENIIGLNSFDKHLTADSEIIGDISGLDIEKIIGLKPDLIVDYNEEFANDFKDTSLNYVSYSPNSIKTIKENIVSLGQDTNTGDRAKDLVDNIDKEIQKIKSSLPSEGKNVAVEIWHDPLTFAEADSYIGELIGLLNCQLKENTTNVDVHIAYNNFPEKRASDKIYLFDKDLTMPGINVSQALKELFDIIY